MSSTAELGEALLGWVGPMIVATGVRDGRNPTNDAK